MTDPLRMAWPALLDAAEEANRLRERIERYGRYAAHPVIEALEAENARLVAALRGIVEGGCPCAEHDCEKCREAYRAARAALAEVGRG